MACSVQRFSCHARFSRVIVVPGSKPFLTDTFSEVKQACYRLTCQNCNSTRTRVSWEVQNQTVRPHGSSYQDLPPSLFLVPLAPQLQQMRLGPRSSSALQTSSLTLQRSRGTTTPSSSG